MRRLLRPLAALLLAGLVFPWARVAAVSLHLSSEHHAAGAEHHAAELETTLHGHHHGTAITDHQHPQVGCDFAGQRARTLQAAGPAPELWFFVAPAPPALNAWAALARSGRAGDHGPPLLAARTILRI